MEHFLIRINCIICNHHLDDPFFPKDLSVPISCSCKTTKDETDIFIPYNILTCSECKTSQIKYIGDLSLIYASNHADSTGSIMKNLHKKVCDIMRKYITTITNITEIGAAKGVLSSLILQEYPCIEKYYIIEPYFIGTKFEKQFIINDYFENVNEESYKDSNTIIISHVFEHFYNPVDILNRIEKNANIENFLLVWPDLEYYKDNHIYHVLNTEHTFYVDNNFIKMLFNNHSFELLEQVKYENHSVIYFFKRHILVPLKLVNENYLINSYFNKLLDKKHDILNFIIKNKQINKKVCIFPASVHTQFLIMLLEITSFDYVLDNSPAKIGKFLYGSNLECKSFKEFCSGKDIAIVLNGGCFNKEVINHVRLEKEQLFVL
jgi:hypothetical protein